MVSKIKPADMNLGANIFQTIRWRRKCAANNIVEKVIKVIAHVTPTIRHTWCDDASDGCEELMGSAKVLRLLALCFVLEDELNVTRHGIHRATIQKDPNAFPAIKTGEVG